MFPGAINIIYSSSKLEIPAIRQETQRTQSSTLIILDTQYLQNQYSARLARSDVFSVQLIPRLAIHTL